jgi:mRNA interferase MazF
MIGNLKRGDVVWVDFGNPRGSEPSGRRPALVVQNDTGNIYSPNTILAAITRSIGEYPVNVRVEPNESGLPSPSTIECSLLLTIAKERILSQVGTLPANSMAKVNAALRASLALN